MRTLIVFINSYNNTSIISKRRSPFIFAASDFAAKGIIAKLAEINTPVVKNSDGNYELVWMSGRNAGISSEAARDILWS